MLSKRFTEVKQITKLGIYRFIHGINLNTVSKSYGIADREYWAWKTKDFPNGTFQAGISALLDSKDMINLNYQQLKVLVKALLIGTSKIQRIDGSFEETYPYESSHCVTSLVLFNFMYSYFKYKKYFDIEDKILLTSIAKKAYKFLKNNKETHGVISNHIITTICSKLLTSKFLKLKTNYREIKDFSFTQHKQEGWFPEYGGADPGYQTLLNHYLICTFEILKIDILMKIYNKSVKFTKSFCFPDGTYIGEAGSRGSFIVYPSGTILSEMSDWFVKHHSPNIACVNPINSDNGNFVPILNSWSFFSKTFVKDKNYYFKKCRVIYKDAGLYVFSSSKSMMIISENQSVVRKINLHNGNWYNDNLISFVKNNYTTQGLKFNFLKIDKHKINFNLNKRKIFEVHNSPIKAITLRIVSIIIFFLPMLQRHFKKILKHFVMDQIKPIKTNINVYISLKDPLYILHISNHKNWKMVNYGYQSHMASSNHFDKRAL